MMTKLGSFLNLLLAFDGAAATVAVGVAQFYPQWSTGCHAVVAITGAVGAVLAYLAARGHK